MSFPPPLKRMESKANFYWAMMSNKASYWAPQSISRASSPVRDLSNCTILFPLRTFSSVGDIGAQGHGIGKPRVALNQHPDGLWLVLLAVPITGDWGSWGGWRWHISCPRCWLLWFFFLAITCSHMWGVSPSKSLSISVDQTSVDGPGIESGVRDGPLATHPVPVGAELDLSGPRIPAVTPVGLPGNFQAIRPRRRFPRVTAWQWLPQLLPLSSYPFLYTGLSALPTSFVRTRGLRHLIRRPVPCRFFNPRKS